MTPTEEPDMRGQNMGAPAEADQALVASDGAASVSSLTGFDPSRWTRRQHNALESDRGFLPAKYWPLALTIIESPYAGDIEANVAYARAAVRDSLLREEAPIASHLLYTQPGVLRDDEPEERELGIQAGLMWREVAERIAFYVDRGWSRGMLAARALYEQEGISYEIRSLAIATESAARDSEDAQPSPPRNIK